jgi:hypothetical protein
LPPVGADTISLNRTSRSAPGGSHLVDAVIDGYVTWREESAAVQATYEHWQRVSRDERAAAFDGYVAALDREELTASAYRRLVERAAAQPAADA